MAVENSSPSDRSRQPLAKSVGVICATRVLRESLVAGINAVPELIAFDFFGGDESSIRRVGELIVDVLLVDLAPPHIRDLARRVRQRSKNVPIVAFSSNGDESEVIGFAEAGVLGFVPRDASLEEVRHSLLVAIRGELHCTDRISAGLARRLSTIAQENGDEFVRARLTVREGEIVQLIDLGLSNKEIASHLSIELATVKNHVHNLLEKIGVHSRGEASAKLAGRISLARSLPTRHLR